MKIHYTILKDEEFESWNKEMENIESKLNHFQVQSGAYVPNVTIWKKNMIYETEFVMINNKKESEYSEDGRIYILVDKNYIKKKRKEIINSIFSIDKFQNINFEANSFDNNYIYVNPNMIINIYSLNIHDQDCELVCGRDFFYN